MTDKISSVILDSSHTTSKGVEIKMVLDVSVFQSHMERYHEALLFARQIPQDLNLVTGFDPLAIYVAEHYKHLDNSQVVEMARRQYAKLSQDAYREASILALIREPLQFPDAPTPYKEEVVSDSLPGIIELPGVKKNLANPLEARLKQVLDILDQEPEILIGLQSMVEQGTVAMTRKAIEVSKADAAGFQPKRARPAKPVVNGTTDLEPKTEE